MALELYLWKNYCEIEYIMTCLDNRRLSSTANFLAGVPTGRIVVALDWEKVYQLLGEDTKLTFESIGSALICSIVTVKPGQLLVGKELPQVL